MLWVLQLGSLGVAKDVRRVDARHKGNQQFSFNANEPSLDSALIGARCDLSVVVTAYKSDWSNVVTADNVSQREEASNLFWSDLTLIVNGVEISDNVRTDITWYMIDRFHNAARKIGNT